MAAGGWRRERACRGHREGWGDVGAHGRGGGACRRRRGAWSGRGGEIGEDEVWRRVEGQRWRRGRARRSRGRRVASHGSRGSRRIVDGGGCRCWRGRFRRRRRGLLRWRRAWLAVVLAPERVPDLLSAVLRNGITTAGLTALLSASPILRRPSPGTMSANMSSGPRFLRPSSSTPCACRSFIASNSARGVSHTSKTALTRSGLMPLTTRSMRARYSLVVRRVDFLFSSWNASYEVRKGVWCALRSLVCSEA
jgi:hypothetical protein